jgi:hypothetical protein
MYACILYKSGFKIQAVTMYVWKNECMHVHMYK